MICWFVKIAHHPALSLRVEWPFPSAIRPAAFLSNSSRHAAHLFSISSGSSSPSRLSTVGCRLSAPSPKPLIPNPFPHSPLTPFLPPLARTPAKSFPYVSYENIGGWGSGPTNPSHAPRHTPPLFLGPRSHLPPVTSHLSPVTPSPLPICRLRHRSPLRDTGISQSVAAHTVTRSTHVQPHR